MGKHEAGTPKYIANKIKAKGLQKLRWYCQMCQKQCRDENGFKCHTMSESHHRQLLLFADNASRYMDQFSREFSQGYLNLLKRQFGTRRVAANRVYQEYIADRTHIHMNATQWLTLTAFVKWLGRTGQCVVDETEKGWYITYVDRDPETIAAQEKKAKKEKMDKDDQERLMEFIEKQVEQGKSEEKDDEEKQPLLRNEDDAPVVIHMKINSKKNLLVNQRIKIEKTESEASGAKRIKIEKEDSPSAEGWLKRGLVVKITKKNLGTKYYKAKGVVESVEDAGFVGKVKLSSPEEVEGHVIKSDQKFLETVIPAIGKKVLVLWGKHKNEVGLVKRVRVEDFCVDVEMEHGSVVEMMAYERVCKYVGDD